MTKQAKVARLKEQRDKLNLQIQHELAKTQKAERERERLRRQLVGEAVLDQVEQGAWPKDRLNSLMDKRLTNAKHRALFDLPPLEDADREESTEGLVSGTTHTGSDREVAGH